MALARIGPLTAVVESLAAAVAAGILLGGFVLGSAGLLMGRSRHELQARALADGYVGGIVGAVLVLIDLLRDSVLL